jgi:hypothetical protein
LDRIDQQARPLDNSYCYSPAPASNVTVYVIDSGIRITTRISVGGASCRWSFFDNTPIAGHRCHSFVNSRNDTRVR